MCSAMLASAFNLFCLKTLLLILLAHFLLAGVASLKDEEGSGVDTFLLERFKTGMCLFCFCFGSGLAFPLFLARSILVLASFCFCRAPSEELDSPSETLDVFPVFGCLVPVANCVLSTFSCDWGTELCLGDTGVCFCFLCKLEAWDLEGRTANVELLSGLTVEFPVTSMHIVSIPARLWAG